MRLTTVFTDKSYHFIALGSIINLRSKRLYILYVCCAFLSAWEIELSSDLFPNRAISAQSATQAHKRLIPRRRDSRSINWTGRWKTSDKTDGSIFGGSSILAIRQCTETNGPPDVYLLRRRCATSIVGHSQTCATWVRGSDEGRRGRRRMR